MGCHVSSMSKQLDRSLQACLGHMYSVAVEGRLRALLARAEQASREVLQHPDRFSAKTSKGLRCWKLLSILYLV